jgi:hypothetical protein
VLGDGVAIRSSITRRRDQPLADDGDDGVHDAPEAVGS